MSGMFDEDQNYDGQGKSRQEEVFGGMMVAGCLFLAVLMALLIAFTVFIVAVIL